MQDNIFYQKDFSKFVGFYERYAYGVADPDG